VGARFSAPVQTGPEAHPSSYTIGIWSFQGVKWPERGLYHPLYLAPRLKSEWSYTSTPLWAFVVCSRVNERHLCLYIDIHTRVCNHGISKQTSRYSAKAVKKKMLLVTVQEAVIQAGLKASREIFL
jgi:hypothetical protein